MDNQCDVLTHYNELSNGCCSLAEFGRLGFVVRLFEKSANRALNTDDVPSVSLRKLYVFIDAICKLFNVSLFPKAPSFANSTALLNTATCTIQSVELRLYSPFLWLASLGRLWSFIVVVVYMLRDSIF